MVITAAVCIGLFVLGSALGSFAAASVWRLRAADLRAQPATAKTPADKVLLKRLGKQSLMKDRSRCLHCGYQLAWYDLVPVISWLSLAGKCRQCRRPIGSMEILAELGLGSAFAVSYLALVHSYQQGELAGIAMGWLIALTGIWLVSLVLLAVQWMYDAKWYSLITPITIALGVCALVTKAILLIAGLVSWQDTLLTTLLALVLMPGFYGLLCVVSRQAWVGLGDVYLLVPFALFVPSWQHAFLVVFGANLLGCLVIIPSMLRGRITRSSRVPFGPFLIAAFVLAQLFGQALLSWYFQLLAV